MRGWLYRRRQSIAGDLALYDGHQAPFETERGVCTLKKIYILEIKRFEAGKKDALEFLAERMRASGIV